jgi:hypothetical protein
MLEFAVELPDSRSSLSQCPAPSLCQLGDHTLCPPLAAAPMNSGSSCLDTAIATVSPPGITSCLSNAQTSDLRGCTAPALCQPGDRTPCPPLGAALKTIITAISLCDWLQLLEAYSSDCCWCVSVNHNILLHLRLPQKLLAHRWGVIACEIHTQTPDNVQHPHSASLVTAPCAHLLQQPA